MTAPANDLHNDSPRGSVIPAGNMATGLLKLIALAFMLIGHVLGAALSFFISYRGVVGVLASDFAQHKHITTVSTSPLAWPFTVCHCVGFFLLGFSFVWAIVRMIRFWKYPGVNPGMILYPHEHGDPFGGSEDISEGGDEA